MMRKIAVDIFPDALRLLNNIEEYGPIHNVILICSDLFQDDRKCSVRLDTQPYVETWRYTDLPNEYCHFSQPRGSRPKAEIGCVSETRHRPADDGVLICESGQQHGTPPMEQYPDVHRWNFDNGGRWCSLCSPKSFLREYFAIYKDCKHANIGSRDG